MKNFCYNGGNVFECVHTHQHRDKPCEKQEKFLHHPRKSNDFHLLKPTHPTHTHLDGVCVFSYLFFYYVYFPSMIIVRWKRNARERERNFSGRKKKSMWMALVREYQRSSFVHLISFYCFLKFFMLRGRRLRDGLRGQALSLPLAPLDESNMAIIVKYFVAQISVPLRRATQTTNERETKMFLLCISQIYKMEIGKHYTSEVEKIVKSGTLTHPQILLNFHRTTHSHRSPYPPFCARFSRPPPLYDSFHCFSCSLLAVCSLPHFALTLFLHVFLLSLARRVTAVYQSFLLSLFPHAFSTVGHGISTARCRRPCTVPESRYNKFSSYMSTLRLCEKHLNTRVSRHFPSAVVRNNHLHVQRTNSTHTRERSRQYQHALVKSAHIYGHLNGYMSH
jgi:hypothetical protein